MLKNLQASEVTTLWHIRTVYIITTSLLHHMPTAAAADVVLRKVVMCNVSKCYMLHRDWTDASLTSAVEWLLTQCGRTQTECRHACMQLVYNLSPCLPGLLLHSPLYHCHPPYIVVKCFNIC